MTTTKEQDKNLLEASEELFGCYCPCMRCKHYIKEPGSVYCKAFPNGDGIPEEIFFGENLHKEPYPGDHGIQFEPIEE